jgi:hypothetical protein
MDGPGLMESLLNSIKLLHVAVASLTVKLQIFANPDGHPPPPWTDFTIEIGKNGDRA